MKYLYFLGVFSIGVIFVNVSGMWNEAIGYGFKVFGGVAFFVEFVKAVREAVNTSCD